MPLLHRIVSCSLPPAYFRSKYEIQNILTFSDYCQCWNYSSTSYQRFFQELRGERFENLAVRIHEPGAQTVIPFMRKHKLSFPALTDAKGITTGHYQTTGVPENFIIDKDGIIVEKVIGPRDWAAPGVIRSF